MKKLILPILSLVILSVLAYGLVMVDKVDQKVTEVDDKLDTLAQQEKNFAQQEANFEAGQSTQDSTIVMDLIGTGNWLGNGIATSTTATGVRVVAPTVFQFASSTNQAYWNTPFTNY